MICLAVSASRRNQGDIQLRFFSPDTDVFVLAIANYDLLPKYTSISMVSGILQIQPFWDTLGNKKAKALPAFHAFSGADNTGRFAGIGKATWLKIYLLADDDIIEALRMLGNDSEVTEKWQKSLARFVCAAYSPKGINIRSIPELRWHMFCKYMADSDKLPPTVGALKQHILRAHAQARVWDQAAIPQQELLDPLENGYYKDNKGMMKPITTEVPPAPEAIIEMVRCHCKSDCSSQRCSCRSKNLRCTDLCLCTNQCENDEDSQADIHGSDDSDSDNDE
ncbi:uncharacterized protein LOC123514692 [Portunus trituberculatus]|nr:uncharacterized protein LOC123514692 [Portunus trituberculatus]